MDEREVLRKLAEDKIVAVTGRALGLIAEAAARLLADVYAAGLAHGITPESWAAVSALPGACWDTSLAQARQQQRAADRTVTMSEGPMVVPPPVAVRPGDQRYLSPGSTHVAPPPSQGRRGPSR